MADAKTQRDENRFWLQVMGDKARIVLKELHPLERDLISDANGFIKLFDKLLAQAVESENQKEVNTAAWTAVQDFRRFVLKMIRTQISEKNVVGILPEYLGVYVNECELCLDKLNAAIKGIRFTTNALDIALVWMLNGYLAAIHMVDNLGIGFLEHKTKANGFAQGFLELHLRAQIMSSFKRTGLDHFPMLDDFYNDIAAHMTRYAEFAVDLIGLLEKRSFVGTLSMLDLDDHYRISCYIMKQLASVSNIRPAVCDPAAPRRE